MKILQIHNSYEHRGGEDSVVEAEASLLRANGHTVLQMRRSFNEIAVAGPVGAALDAVWSRRTYRELRERVGDERPDIVHAHNTFPLISPSLYWAADEARLPVVQTLHNFRLLCPQGSLLRNGKVCERCLGHLPLPAVAHACYRSSRPATAVLASMLALHRSLGTWTHKVDRYIALNAFCRNLFVAGGLPAERIAIKPHFVATGDMLAQAPRSGLLFVGRLSAQKGIDVLASAAADLPAGTLRVIGDGPDSGAFDRCGAVVRLGAQPRQRVDEEMARATALVFPSISYEAFGLVIVEAFARGTPVIASRLGGTPELVVNRETGLLCDPGDANDLGAKLRWALAHPVEMADMGRRARKLAAVRYSQAANYGQLMQIYADAVRSRTERNGGLPAVVIP